MNKEVAILGNGFDLSNGLKSKYSDFFSKRINKELESLLNKAFLHLKEELSPESSYDAIFRVRKSKDPYHTASKINGYGVDKIYTDLLESELTFWDLILYMFDDDSNSLQWQDVERKMLEFLSTPEGAEDIPSLSQILSLIDGKSPDETNARTLFCLHLAYWLPVEGREDYASKYYDSKDVINYLYSELRSFKKYFSIYINSVINESYKEKARKLLLSIIKKSALPEVDDLVFTFSYTNSFNTLNSEVSIVSVHGTVKNDNIIFGINQEKISPSRPIFRFTRTFRRMTETKLVSTYEQEILLPRNEVYEIAFSGHSLSKLDYSYSQTTFDHYGLYASNISLTFYYEIYEGITQEAMELDLADKISKLLHNYSDSIDNLKKGKDLLHKLLLEEGLTIKEII